MIRFRESQTHPLTFALLMLLMFFLGYAVSVFWRARVDSKSRAVSATAQPWPQPAGEVSAESLELIHALEKSLRRQTMADESGKRYEMVCFDSLAGSRWDDQGGAFSESAMGLDGKTVMMIGFMVPLDLENGKAGRFMLTRDMAFYKGQRQPKPDQMVVVWVEGARVPFHENIPVAVCGRMEIGAFRDHENRPFLFRLTARETFLAKALDAPDG